MGGHLDSEPVRLVNVRRAKDSLRRLAGELYAVIERADALAWSRDVDRLLDTVDDVSVDLWQLLGGTFEPGSNRIPLAEADAWSPADEPEAFR